MGKIFNEIAVFVLAIGLFIVATLALQVLLEFGAWGLSWVGYSYSPALSVNRYQIFTFGVGFYFAMRFLGISVDLPRHWIEKREVGVAGGSSNKSSDTIKNLLDTHVNVGFSAALEHIKAGGKAYRSGWGATDQYVVAQPLSKNIGHSSIWNPHNKKAAQANGGYIDVAAYCVLKNAEGQLVMGWTPSTEDLFSSDWHLSMFDEDL